MLKHSPVVFPLTIINGEALQWNDKPQDDNVTGLFLTCGILLMIKFRSNDFAVTLHHNLEILKYCFDFQKGHPPLQVQHAYLLPFKTCMTGVNTELIIY